MIGDGLGTDWGYQGWIWDDVVYDATRREVTLFSGSRSVHFHHNIARH
jgi:hypothetical protein